MFGSVNKQLFMFGSVFNLSEIPLKKAKRIRTMIASALTNKENLMYKFFLVQFLKVLKPVEGGVGDREILSGYEK